MTTIFSAFRTALSMLGLVLLVACGGGGDGLPEDTEALREAFYHPRSVLCNYINDQATECWAINPDTVVWYEEDQGCGMYCVNLSVQYRGEILYQVDHGFLVEMLHGYLSTREYLILINKWNKVTAYPKLFVDGKQIEAGFPSDWPLLVREYGSGWIMMRSLAPYYIVGPSCSWAMYNVQTSELRSFGRADC